jgi:hypothetical protein
MRRATARLVPDEWFEDFPAALDEYAESPWRHEEDGRRFCDPRRRCHGFESPPSRPQLTLSRYGGQPPSGLVNRSVRLEPIRQRRESRRLPIRLASFWHVQKVFELLSPAMHHRHLRGFDGALRYLMMQG